MLQESCSNIEIKNLTLAVKKKIQLNLDVMLLSTVGLRKIENSMRVANQNGKHTGITGGVMEKPVGCNSSRGAGIPCWRADMS